MKRGKNKKPRKKKPPIKVTEKRQSSSEKSGSGITEVSLEELKAIVARAKGLSSKDLSKLDAAVDTLAVLTRELEAKGASVRRLRRLIFGPSTEKTSKVLGNSDKEESSDAKQTEESDDKEDLNSGADDTGVPGSEDDGSEKEKEKSKKKRKGHGRNGADKYTGAERTKVSHGTLGHKDRCPECLKGKVYRQREPSKLVRVTGVAPLEAKVYELERLRCNLCGEVFTASAPEGVGEEKYDKQAAAMIAMLKYGCGFPFNRLERLEGDLGIPLPASTQWEVVDPLAQILMPVYTELIRRAAQGEVLHNDDTTARILSLGDNQIEEPNPDDDVGPNRKGIFTSGIVSIAQGIQIALFFTGRKHAGENLAAVLRQRAEALGTPIQMSDGLAVNTAGDMETISANCNSHARRKFVDVASSYREQVKHVLNQFKEIYANDDETKKQNMPPAERLKYHQEHSEPIMTEFEKWLQDQFDTRQVEPNSDLGVAIKYLQDHWPKLTLFLHKPGAPLDNNICERILKKAILHRKNALFFKTNNGAKVGDIFMSLIHTAELCQANPFDYLVAMAHHPEDIANHPNQWMPWNYKSRAEALSR